LLLFFERDNPPSILVLITMWLLGLLLHPLGRALSKRLLHTLGLWGRRVVILGAGQAGQRVAKALLEAPLDGLLPIAFFDDDPNKIGTVIGSLPVVGSLAYADVYASKRAIRHAIVAIPTAPAGLMTALVSRKGRVFTWVQVVPELPGLPAEDVYTGNLDGLLALEVRNGLYAQTSRVFKRSIDLLGASLGGLIISPLLVFLYVWVRLDSPGGAFYWSSRIGEGGRPFKCLKFRTMYADADARLQDLLETNPALHAEYSRYHKLENDPRITRAGRVLRKVSLDELSQLYNVIIGEMSLIGPRPYLARELDDMGNHAKTILLAKPGMTGYWQVSGRSNVSFAERLEMEAHYVRNWSIWWDIILLLQTVRVVLKREGAH
ncbi:MAG: undecaprenyl-phosphate galactose phosphotransferase WbaP, partial [Deinococcota bacterium]